MIDVIVVDKAEVGDAGSFRRIGHGGAFGFNGRHDGRLYMQKGADCS